MIITNIYTYYDTCFFGGYVSHNNLKQEPTSVVISPGSWVDTCPTISATGHQGFQKLTPNHPLFTIDFSFLVLLYPFNIFSQPYFDPFWGTSIYGTISTMTSPHHGQSAAFRASFLALAGSKRKAYSNSPASRRSFSLRLSSQKPRNGGGLLCFLMFSFWLV